MKNKTFGVVSIFASFSFFILYGVFSWTIPYSPHGFLLVNMEYLIGLACFILYIYLLFFYKKNGVEDPRYKEIFLGLTTSALASRVFLFIIFSPLVMFTLIGNLYERWPSYPTKYLADEAFSVSLNCTVAEPFGKRKHFVMINAIDLKSNEIYEFPWPINATPKCPGNIAVTGKKWAFGSYIETLEEKGRL